MPKEPTERKRAYQRRKLKRNLNVIFPKRPNISNNQEIRYLNSIPKDYKPKIFGTNLLMQNFLKLNILINRSERHFSSEEIEILCLGLNFCYPSDKSKPSTNEITSLKHEINSAIFFKQDDIDTNRHEPIVRGLTETQELDRTSAINRQISDVYLASLQEPLYKRGNKTPHIKKRLPTQKTWVPPNQTWEAVPQIRNILFKCEKEIDNNAGKPLPLELNYALKTLKNDPSIYIIPADKGGGLVIWTKTEYLLECDRQLSDTETYRELTINEKNLKIETLTKVIQQTSKTLLKGRYITPAEHSNIQSNIKGPSAFYLLPKIHKPINTESQTFSGRPIVATHSNPTKPIDLYITELTKPLLPRIPGSLLDSCHLLNLLPKECTAKDVRLLTADVNSLYPSIPWKEGNDAAVELYVDNYNFLENYAITNNLPPPPPPNLFRKLIKLVLENSIIHFQNDRYFHQIKGTAMGCNISVYFANCYMYSITKHIVNEYPGKTIFFGRFIDDLILITRDSDKEIKKLFESITNKHVTYTIEPALKTTNFLDLTIYIKDNFIHTKTYSKPTSIPFFLHAKSAHPEHLIDSIPYAQLLRIKRSCSLANTFTARANELLYHFTLRGYPSWILRKAKKKCDKIPRDSLLVRKIKEPWRNKFNFKLTFSNQLNKNKVKYFLNNIIELIEKHYNGGPLSQPFTDNNIYIAYKVDKSLASQFSRKYKNPQE